MLTRRGGQLGQDAAVGRIGDGWRHRGRLLSVSFDGAGPIGVRAAISADFRVGLAVIVGRVDAAARVRVWPLEDSRRTIATGDDNAGAVLGQPTK